MLTKTTNTEIQIKGAKVHNLKNLNVSIPNNKLVVVTGVSGSGKTSLCIDTLFAEGQRRYVESLSSYARQFLSRMNKPEVEYIKGLCPAIAIDHGNNWFSAQFHPESRKQSWDIYYGSKEKNYKSKYSYDHNGSKFLSNFFNLCS